MLNTKISKPHEVIEDCLDSRWSDTIHNHYDNPLHFMDDILQWEGVFPDGTVSKYIQAGKDAFAEASKKDFQYNKLYEDVAQKVKDRLIARGFTTSMLYSTVGFTTQKTGVLSKQRVMLGKRDCYFKDSRMDDSKLFHDIYINLSYGAHVSNEKITKNSYALYALTRELSRLLPIRVFVVNHVGTRTPSCYSYVLKRFGMAISPEEFLFFTSDVKRTFGFAYYNILNNGYQNTAVVGNPKNTVSIAEFELNKEIDKIFKKIEAHKPELFRIVS